MTLVEAAFPDCISPMVGWRGEWRGRPASSGRWANAGAFGGKHRHFFVYPTTLWQESRSL